MRRATARAHAVGRLSANSRRFGGCASHKCAANGPGDSMRRAQAPRPRRGASLQPASSPLHTRAAASPSSSACAPSLLGEPVCSSRADRPPQGGVGRWHHHEGAAGAQARQGRPARTTASPTAGVSCIACAYWSARGSEMKSRPIKSPIHTLYGVRSAEPRRPSDTVVRQLDRLRRVSTAARRRDGGARAHRGG